MIALEKLDLPQYGSFTSRIFPYYGKHFHTVELDKTMEIGFSNLFLQYFPNISILWKRSILSSVGLYCSNNQFWKITSLYIHRTSLYIHCTSLHTSLYIRHYMHVRRPAAKNNIPAICVTDENLQTSCGNSWRSFFRWQDAKGELLPIWMEVLVTNPEAGKTYLWSCWTLSKKRDLWMARK